MVVSNIKSLVTRHPVIFISLSLFYIVTIMSFMFAYCNGREAKSYDAYYKQSASRFQVGFETPAPLGAGTFDELKAGGNIEKIQVYYDEERVLSAFPWGKSPVAYMGRKLTDGEEGRSVILPGFIWVRNDLKLGDQFNILGEDYEIVGLRDIAEYIEIPFNDYTQKTYDVYGVDVTLEYLPSESETNQFMGLLGKVFGSNSYVIPPDKRDYSTEHSISSKSIQLFLVLSLSVINIFFLYTYMLGKRKTDYAVARICGCSVGRGFLILLAEFIIYEVIYMLLSMVTFSFLGGMLFKNGYYSVQISDMLIACAIYFGITLLIFMPKFYKYSKTVIVQLRK